MSSLLIHSSLVTHSFRFPIDRLSLEPIAWSLPPMDTLVLILSVLQHSMPCRVRLSARLSTTRGRYSLMRLHMIGRGDMKGTCLRSGTRFCCIGVRRMRLRNGHRSPGWATSDHPSNRNFRCPPSSSGSSPPPRFPCPSVPVSSSPFPTTFPCSVLVLPCYIVLRGFLHCSPAMSHPPNFRWFFRYVPLKFSGLEFGI